MKQAGPSRQLLQTVNFAFMKIFDFLVKIAIFWPFCFFSGDLRHKLRPNRARWLNNWADYVANKLGFSTIICDTNHPRKSRKAKKMAIFTKKSKIFIKAKLTVSKSCLLGPACFMICCILGDAHLQKVKYWKSIW